MKYRELLELYDKKKLPEELQKKVEQDIERQEAISEYLFEKDELGEELHVEYNQSEEYDKTEQFAGMIKKSIRKAFIKMGIITGSIVIVIVCLILFVFPNIVSLFYYDPGKEIFENTNQMSLDLRVYTEFKIPGYVRDNVVVRDKGYGNYDINIYQNVSYNGKFTNIAGALNKGNLNLYDMNLLNPPHDNVFAWFQLEDLKEQSLREIEAAGKEMFFSGGTREQATEALQGLEENVKYVFYATLDKMVDYNEFVKFKKEKNSYANWCAVYTGGRIQNLGIECELLRSCNLGWDTKEYPEMIIWNHDEETQPLENKIENTEVMQTHFESMLRYMGEQESFLKMMNETSEIYKEAAEYIEENGMLIYGYSGIAKKEELLKMNEWSEIYAIEVSELR